MPCAHSMTSSGAELVSRNLDSHFTCATSCDLAGSHLFILHLQESKLRKMAFAVQLVKAQLVVMSKGGLTWQCPWCAQVRPLAIHSNPSYWNELTAEFTPSCLCAYSGSFRPATGGCSIKSG